MLNDDNTIIKDQEEILNEDDKRDLNMSITDSYLYRLVIIQMYWRNQYVTDCLKCSVFSHWFYSLWIAYKGNILYYGVCDNIHLVETSSQIGHELDVNAEISISITVL